MRFIEAARAMASENHKLQLIFDGMPDAALLPPRAGGGREAPRKWKPQLRDVRVSDLPESLRDISRLIGLPATLALVEWRGGTRLSIPREVHADHPLYQALGSHAAHTLAAHYRGEHINVPILSRVSAPLRDRSIRAEYDAGTAIPALAWRFALSERRLHEILNRADAPQPLPARFSRDTGEGRG